MKRISVLFLMLCMVGCDLIPSVIDESIPLPAPVVIDNIDKVPAKPVPAPMPVPAPQPKVVPVEAPAPEVLPQAEPVKPAAPATATVEAKVEAKSTVVTGPKVSVEDKKLWPLETRWSHNTHWSYPGSNTDDANRTKLRKHLAGKPHYVHTDGMTAEQVLNFHDAWHEAERNRMPLPSIKTTVKPERAAVAVSTLTQYTIASCGYCKTDQRDILPNWAAKGWTIKIVDETDNPRGSYPRYELRGADGSFRTHSGSLRNWK